MILVDTQPQEVVVNAEVSNKVNYRVELDGLRAIAVLAVIFYHAGFKICQGGFVGVDVFFVLSGFLMTSIIIKEFRQDKFTLLRFYERRVRRILPMLFFTITCCYYPAQKYLVETEFFYFCKSALLASVGSSNFLFAASTKGYFDTRTDLIPLVHTWTLGVEEQFYVIIPLIFILLWRLGRNAVLFVIASLALVSFCLTFSPHINSVYKFYMLYTRFWELAIGSLIVFLPKQTPSNIFAYIGLACIFVSIFGYNENMPNPSFFTLLPTIGSALIIVFGNDEIISGRVLSFKPMVWIGLTSYSSYLIHQPVFAFARVQSFEPINETTYIMLILLTLGLSYVTWRFVENPFRDREKFSFRSVLFALLVYFICIRVDSFSVLTRKDLQFKNLQTYTTSTSSLVTESYNYSNVTIHNDPVQKSMPAEELFLYGRNSDIGKKCFLSHCYGPKTTPVELCRFGRDRTSPPSYFLFGDSLSMAVFGAFDDLNYPGMFAGLHGGHCSPLLRINMNTTKTQISQNGTVKFNFPFINFFITS
jgi:peptidoglycan/LPS O-acetylase OafA/YrhL